MIETGVWIASDLISFRFYGIAPSALLRNDRTLGRAQFGPKRLLSSRVLPTGGLAVLRISFLATTGGIKTAILQLNCALGEVPRERTVEGVRLSFDGSTVEFTEEAGSRVVFLSMRSQLRGATGTIKQVRPAESPATSLE